MKKLIWKELMESRFIPLAYAALLATVLLVWDIMGNYVASHGGRVTDRMTADNGIVVLACALFIVGLFPGCNTVAGETSHGTLSFLSAIPIGRAKIWLSKVLAGIITMVASAIALVLTFSMVLWLVFHSAVLPAILSVVLGSSPAVSDDAMVVGYTVTIIVFAALYTYSVSLFSSTLTDRPLAATGVALIIGVGLLAAFNAFATEHFQSSFVLLLGAVVVTPGFFLASWLSFKETRRSSSLRARISGIGCAAVWLGVMWSLGTFYFYEEWLATTYIPMPTFISNTNLGTQDSKGYLTGVNSDFKFQARAGQQYVGTVLVVSTGRIQPLGLTAVSGSGDLGATVHQAIVKNLYIIHKPQKLIQYGSLYSLAFVYKPTLPVGHETSTILVKLPNGKTIATVHIIVNKSELFVPDISSFPDRPVFAGR